MNNFHVGLPCMKLSLNPSTQKQHGKAAKTCSVGAAWLEMNDERIGRDKTIEHERTKDNVWLCGNTNMDMENVIQSEIDRINEDRAAHGKRKLRKDAVSAIELIQKPPMDIMGTLTRDEQIELLRDSDEVVESILHDWRSEWKTLATVIHFDEFGGRSAHPHKIFMPISRDEDGCLILNAKRDFNLKFFTFMNREYPARMREKGYPVLDCAIYENMTNEEREEHKEKKKDYGLEGYEYKQMKTAEQEAQIQANAQLLATQAAQISNEEERLRKQREQNKDMEVKILSKKSIEALPEPALTIDRKHYKVPAQDYKRLLATAKQVEVIRNAYKEKQRELDHRETALEKREMEVTRKKTTLAITEKMELAVLRVLKKSVEWIVGQLPEGNYIRHLLERALRGEDLSRQRRLKEAVTEKVRSYCVER